MIDCPFYMWDFARDFVHFIWPSDEPCRIIHPFAEVIPEPSSALLQVVAMGVLVWWRRGR